MRAALFGGDDATDLDAFDALDGARRRGRASTSAVRVGVRSDEGPAAIVERADLVVDGVQGFAAVLAALADAVKFRDLLRVSVLLFGGDGHGAGGGRRWSAPRGEDTNTLVYVARRLVVRGVAGRALARPPAGDHTGDRAPCSPTRDRTNTLPELEPGTVLFNRLWPLIVLGLVSAAVGIFVPQVPAIATGYCLLVALLWRNQSRAVEAIEGRDGVEFWLDRSSPLGRPSCCACPGLRQDRAGRPRPAPLDSLTGA